LIKKALLFLFAGLPGLHLFLSGMHSTAVLIVSPDRRPPLVLQEPLLNFVITAIGLLLGAFLLLIGAGRLRQCMYLLVFVPFPVLLALNVLIVPPMIKDVEGWFMRGVLLAVGWPIIGGIIAFVIHRHYEKLSRSREDTAET
jgi:hypothetical protein